MPPINLARVFAVPAQAAGDQPPVYVVACRPTDDALGFDIRYDDSLAGDFPIVGRSASFGLPVAVGLAASSTVTTLRLSLLPDGAGGARFDRDSGLLRNWTGGATEGRNDELLVILCGGGAVQEMCSIAGTPTLVSAGTFDVPVLRGRLGTAGLAWTPGAEAWVVHSSGLAALSHADFMAAALDGATLPYLPPGAYSRAGTYVPADAYAERVRRAAAGSPLVEFGAQPDAEEWVPTLELQIPEGYAVDAGDTPGGDWGDLDHGGSDFGAPTGAAEYAVMALAPSMCGWSEYPGFASTPPRYYKRRNASGAIVLAQESTGLINTTTTTFSGVAIRQGSSGLC